MTIQIINLDDPKQAREYLSNIYLAGRHVTEFRLANGKTIKVSDMNDEQVVDYACELHQKLGMQVFGSRGADELN